MPASTILDVAIGVVLVYVIFSLFCTTINEWIARFLALRAAGLWRGIAELLDDPEAKGIAAVFHSHPLIDSVRPPSEPTMRRAPEAHYPSYISASTFASVIMDIAMTVTPPGIAGGRPTATLNPTVAPQTAAANATPAAQAARQKIVAGAIPVPSVLRAILQDVNGDAVAVRQRLETWFDHSMERVSGWYKRRAQVILFGIAVVLTIAFNVDTIQIAKRIASDAGLRAQIVLRAEHLVQSSTGANSAQKTAPGAAIKPTSKDSTSTADSAKKSAGLNAATKTASSSTKDTTKKDSTKKDTTTKKDAGKTAIASAAATTPPKTGSDTSTKNGSTAAKTSADSAAANQIAVANSDLIALEKAGLPIGWACGQTPPPGVEMERCDYTSISWDLMKVLGWFLSALALSLGAPFWFDTLNKLVNLRQTGEPPASSAKAS